MLTTNKLTVGYDKKIIISDVNISVSSGQIVTLIGPNGAGKSTLLRTITTELKALSGGVFLQDQETAHMPLDKLAKQLSMVMTGSLSPQLMTCREVVATGRYPYTGRLGILSKEDWEIVDAAMAKLNTSALSDELFTELSDGQRQRVMLSRALSQEPQVLILDEPTSYLDIKYKLEILTAIKSLAREQNIAILMSLHELDLARIISDEIVCVKNGAIDRIGLPEDIFTGDYIGRLFDIDRSALLPELTGCF